MLEINIKRMYTEKENKKYNECKKNNNEIDFQNISKVVLLTYETREVIIIMYSTLTDWNTNKETYIQSPEVSHYF